MLALIVSVILSIEADFVQTKTVAMMAEPQVSTGHMTYRAPDYMRWAYSSPQTMVWEIDGDKSNVNPQVQKLLRMIIASIADNHMNDPQVQRETKRMFRTVNIIMDDDHHVARRVELTEKNGDSTIIEFSNVVAK